MALIESLKRIQDQLVDCPIVGVALDTLRRAMPGKSENEQKDMSAVIDNCGEVSQAFNCFTGLVHHSPRSDNTRGSGNNALDAAIDIAWGVNRIEDTMQARAWIADSRDGEDGGEWVFEIVPVDIGYDPNGVLIKSCHVQIITPIGKRTGVSGFKEGKLPPQLQQLYDLLVEAVTAGPQLTQKHDAAIPAGVNAIAREQAHRFCTEKGWLKSRHQFNTVAYRLKDYGKIGLGEKFVWLTERKKAT
jgi:hypothetical protein